MKGKEGKKARQQRIEQAFRQAPRENFVAEGYRERSELDTPLPIGFGQTISQPTTVRMMLEWLDARPGQKILDVGSGSGWTTALLSHLTGASGHVFAVEIVPQLVEFGRENCQRLGIKNVSFYQAADAYGLPEQAPFDRILVSAAAREVPGELKDQLATGGKLIVPVDHDILELTKLPGAGWETITHSGFVFVPLV